jgi:hypothetical protein
MVSADLGSSSEMGLNIIVCLYNAIQCVVPLRLLNSDSYALENALISNEDLKLQKRSRICSIFFIGVQFTNILLINFILLQKKYSSS